VGVFEKLPWENDLDHESSTLLIRWLNNTPGIQPARTQPLKDKQITPQCLGLNIRREITGNHKCRLEQRAALGLSTGAKIEAWAQQE
jgi:hypothetical protein